MKIENCLFETAAKLQKAKKFFQSLGWHCKILAPEPDPAISACENADYEFDYADPNSDSGLFIIIQLDTTDESDAKFVLHVNNLVISKKDRGTGLGKRIVSELVNIFGEDEIKAFEYSDYSNGFWNHIQKYFPYIEFKDDLND